MKKSFSIDAFGSSMLGNRSCFFFAAYHTAGNIITSDELWEARREDEIFVISPRVLVNVHRFISVLVHGCASR
jgi:hypothetical protein